MYFSKIAVLAAATMASTVVADNCFAGYAYCSGNLLTQGDYASTIYQTLDAAGQPTDANAQAKALFNCVNNGAIQFIRLCEGNCVNEPFGSQVSDHC
ncbi:hypothetical protein CC77DRAFT_1067281 [Alternaria alternata]|jgi:hypothetical protein|uniref:Uncharacterized protein n=3 Tax=Alternaria sect. Alternaria TaxID=2499237 RepID=A0A177D412_ALTAL|nr:hypothetical protein CC77DRAFT_1067281 [Alternaria alternata]XP_028504447.1 hypothetical protein AA0111_g7964 [Alternaria arborescens]XP_051589479.1 uncharacterized protein J4E82_004444 [Alternaria postmessia]RYN18637.1 hypothetical protein AA0115_g11153 [Alternaria tenuissima]KAH6839289.1 hypothetical protein B0T12DRAFT_490450 [Alternaria alternata]KAI5376776.1 hypothetical protein J4E82_004444 [Alternaria postmessia]OAG14017.1 hypothetical protein CC77DRAFT_1067281 [Alternaria alternata]